MSCPGKPDAGSTEASSREDRRGADTRAWPSLPKRVFLARVERPANGRVSVTADGMPVAEVVVPEGNSMVFVTKPGPLAAASVKVVTFPPVS